MTNRFFKAIITTAVVLGSSNALACSYLINDVKVQNDLGMNVLNKIGISIADVQNVALSDYRWFESVSTPMCPEELTYEGVFSVSFAKQTDQGAAFCSTVLKVTKVESWIDMRASNYNFETIQRLTCTN